MSDSSMVEQSGIQVVVRLRPMSERELKGNTLPVVTASTEKKEVTVIKGTGARTLRNTFAFDNVFTVRMRGERESDMQRRDIVASVASRRAPYAKKKR